MPSPPTRQARPRTAFWSFWTVRRSTPEMGGQVADHGYLVSGDAKLKVTQVQKTPKGYFVHTCELLDGTIHVDDEVTASVDEKRRAAICRNHTATHLLQKALREVLGEHVHQAGSYQDDQITHFDFTHFSAVSPAELAEVERRVNEKIYEALPVTVRTCPSRKPRRWALWLCSVKYGSVVRVVDAGGWRHRVLRRHPCHEHRTDRLLQDFERVQRGCRYPPH